MEMLREPNGSRQVPTFAHLNTVLPVNIHVKCLLHTSLRFIHLQFLLFLLLFLFGFLKENNDWSAVYFSTSVSFLVKCGPSLMPQHGLIQIGLPSFPRATHGELRVLWGPRVRNQQRAHAHSREPGKNIPL